MDRFEKLDKLDLKQKMSFRIVCATFILDCIEKYIYNSLGGDSIWRTTRNTISNVFERLQKIR